MGQSILLVIRQAAAHKERAKGTAEISLAPYVPFASAIPAEEAAVTAGCSRDGRIPAKHEGYATEEGVIAAELLGDCSHGFSTPCYSTHVLNGVFPLCLLLFE